MTEKSIEQMRREVALADCAALGHDPTQVHVLGSTWPTHLVCDRCGASARVVPEGGSA